MNVRIEDGTLYIGNIGTNAESIIAEAFRRATEPTPIQYALLKDSNILWTMAHLARHLLDEVVKQKEQEERSQREIARRKAKALAVCEIAAKWKGEAACASAMTVERRDVLRECASQVINVLAVSSDDPCRDLSFSTYEAEVMPLAFYPGRGTGSITYTALGLAGEAGEVLEKVEGLGLENPAKGVVSASRVAEHAKKALRDDGETVTPERREKIVNELGDVLWYITATAAELGLTLEDVARANIKKLVDRSRRGVLSGEGDKR